MTTPAERSKAIADLTNNPEKFKREAREAAMKDNPRLTEEQFEAAWKQVAHQFGLS